MKSWIYFSEIEIVSLQLWAEEHAFASQQPSVTNGYLEHIWK